MNESVGERIKRLRIEKGWSQRDLEAPGVNFTYISRIESGERTPSEKALREIAVKLGVTPHFLESGTNTGTCPHCGMVVNAISD